MQKLFQEQSTNPSNRSASKDHHTSLIPIPSIKNPTSFPVNCKNNSNIMVEKDGSIMCHYNSKEHETKKQNYNRQNQYPENKILQFEQELQQQRNTKLENWKKRPLQGQIMTKQKKKKVIIISDNKV